MKKSIQLDSFKIIGIAVRTTNENGKAMTDLGTLWSRFYSENIIAFIPNKENNTVYSLYTDYESDYTGEYTTIIGCKVSTLSDIPEGLTGKKFQGGKFTEYTVTGKMPDVIASKWNEIWQNDKQLKRRYTVDFEKYTETAQDLQNATVQIYLAVE